MFFATGECKLRPNHGQPDAPASGFFSRALVAARRLPSSLGRIPVPPCRVNVFGILVRVEASASGWQPFIAGPDGKRRRADFEIPAFVTEDELCQYLADLFHESATSAHPETFRLP